MAYFFKTLAAKRVKPVSLKAHTVHCHLNHGSSKTRAQQAAFIWKKAESYPECVPVMVITESNRVASIGFTVKVCVCLC